MCKFEIDKKGLTHDNGKWKRSWSNRHEPALAMAKPAMTVRKKKKVLLSNLYCQQLERLKQAISQKQPVLVNRRGIVFQQYNARSYTSIVTR